MGLRNTFSTTITDIDRNSTVYVESLNAFPAPIGNVITLEAGTEYILTKPINFGVNQLKIPDAGLIQITTINAPTNLILSELTGTTPLFFGNISRLQILRTIMVSLSGGGHIFDIKSAGVGNPFFVLNEVAAANFAAIGSAEGVNFSSENVGWLNNKGGLTLNDMLDVQVAEHRFTADHEGDGFIITGTHRAGLYNSILATPDAGDAVFNIDSAADIGSMNITDGSLEVGFAGTFFKAGGLDQTDPRILVFNNNNVVDSYYVGVMGFLDNATDTVITDFDTYTDIGGTIFAGANNERFTFSNGVLTYIGLEEVKLVTSLHLSLRKALGASARTVRVALFIDTGSGFVENGSAPLDMDNDLKSFGFSGVETFNTGDKLKAMIKNETNTDDILIVTYDITVSKS